MINGGGGAFGWACTSCAQVSGERVGGLCGGRGVPCHHPIPLPIRLEVKDCRGRAADPDILFLYPPQGPPKIHEHDCQAQRCIAGNLQKLQSARYLHGLAQR